jgi:hypothetical protein
MFEKFKNSKIKCIVTDDILEAVFMNKLLHSEIRFVGSFFKQSKPNERRRQENLAVHGDYAERIYAYMENAKSLSPYSLTTPRDIKVCISRLIKIQIKNFFRFYRSYMGWI